MEARGGGQLHAEARVAAEGDVGDDERDDVKPMRDESAAAAAPAHGSEPAAPVRGRAAGGWGWGRSAGVARGVCWEGLEGWQRACLHV